MPEMSQAKSTKIVLAPFDTIFGRICLERGWATRDQIIACLKSRPDVGTTQTQSPFLAELLVERSVISAEQERSLRAEVSQIAESGAYQVARQDDSSLGRVLVQMGATSQERIAEALRIQEERAATGGSVPRLGEILVEIGAVTFEALQEALRRQAGIVRLRCPGCDARYAVSDRQPGQTYLCRKCTSPLSVDKGTARRKEPEPEEVTRCATNPKNVVGKYVVVKELGRGGSGAVFKAWDREVRRWVALKVLMGSQGVDFLIRFRREAETAAALQHANIVPIYDVGEAGEKHFIAMKYLEGKTLNQRKFDVPQACLIIARVARAIDHAHQKDIVHRDLKPANVMLDESGNPYVMDFGLAKDLFGSFQITLPGTVMGTPGYMPPEQAEGIINQIDRRSDTYSLGAILYELLTGRAPFEGETVMMTIRKVLEEPVTPPSSINPEVPANLEKIVLKTLARKKDERYQSAAELADDLEAHAAGKVVQPRPSAARLKAAPPPPPKQVKTSVGWIVAAVVVAAVLLLFFLLSRS